MCLQESGWRELTQERELALVFWGVGFDRRFPDGREDQPVRCDCAPVLRTGH